MQAKGVYNERDSANRGMGNVEIPTFPTDKLHKFITVLGVAICVWAFYSQMVNSREVRAAAAGLTVEAAGVLEDFRTLQRRAAMADSLRNNKLRPSWEEVSQLNRRAAELRAKAEAGLPVDGFWFGFHFLLLLVGQALAFLGAWAWYRDEHPPRPSVIIEP